MGQEEDIRRTVSAIPGQHIPVSLGTLRWGESVLEDRPKGVLLPRPRPKPVQAPEQLFQVRQRFRESTENRGRVLLVCGRYEILPAP